MRIEAGDKVVVGHVGGQSRSIKANKGRIVIVECRSSQEALVRLDVTPYQVRAPGFLLPLSESPQTRSYWPGPTKARTTKIDGW